MDPPRLNVTGQLAALRRYARALTRDDSRADDLVQDTMLRAFEKRGSFKPGHDLRAWLMSILHNSFVDGLRRADAAERREAQAALEAEAVSPPDQEHAVRLSQVREAFQSLPDEQRAALHLVSIEGLPYAEAAAVLGVPIGTLMSRLGRARAALRHMEEDGPAGRVRPLRLVGGSDGPAD